MRLTSKTAARQHAWWFSAHGAWISVVVAKQQPSAHLHVLRRLDPVTEGPEPEKPPYHKELEPHDEQDGVSKQPQDRRAEAEGLASICCVESEENKPGGMS